jgi:Leucine-rich repeat (LRR) protein
MTNLLRSVKFQVTALQMIDASYNLLRSLRPGTFAGLRTMTSLNISSNQLTAVGPDVFSSSNQLQELYASHKITRRFLNKARLGFRWCWRIKYVEGMHLNC